MLRESKVLDEVNPVSPSVQTNSSPRNPRFASSRFLLPSVSDLIFVLLVTWLSIPPLAQKLLGDAGIGWHIRTGELILATRSVPRVDSFSSTMNGQPWYAWEWLYDLFVGAIHHTAGLNGVVFFSALLIAFTFVLVFRMALARGASLPIAVLMLLLAIFAASIHFLTRPHLLSWLFTLIFFWVLEDYEAGGKAHRLVWLPVIMLAWVNLHGGFLVAFVLQGIYLVGAWTRRSSSTPPEGGHARRIRALVMTGLLMLVATFANPYGYKLHVHIYRYLSDRFLMDHIDEFLSPNFHGLPQKCFAVLVLLGILGAALARHRLGTTQLLVTGFAVYTAVYASRNLPVSAMLLVLVMAPVLSKALAEWMVDAGDSTMIARSLVRWENFAERIGSTQARLRGHAWPILVVLLGVWICLHRGRFASRTVMDAHFDAKRFPVQAVDFLERSQVREAVFCPDSWGGYLIYRLYPRTPVVLDDRHDLYGAEFLKKYLNIVRTHDQGNQALFEMHSSWVLFQRSSAVANLLKEIPEWRDVYHDDTAVLLHLSDGGAAGTAADRTSLQTLPQTH